MKLRNLKHTRQPVAKDWHSKRGMARYTAWIKAHGHGRKGYSNARLIYLSRVSSVLEAKWHRALLTDLNLSSLGLSPELVRAFVEERTADLRPVMQRQAATIADVSLKDAKEKFL